MFSRSVGPYHTGRRLKSPGIGLVALRHLNENLLVQFSVLAGVIVIVLGVAISIVLTSRLNRNLDLLAKNEVSSAPLVGDPLEPLLISGVDQDLRSLREDLKDLRSVIYGTLGGGFVIMYGGLVFIVWRGWRTSNLQRQELESVNVQLEDRVEQEGGGAARGQ